MNRSFEVEIPASGQNLAGTFFPAQQDLGNQAVLLCPATGITQRFYFPFASWLSEQGFSVLVFDYRGIGRSLAESHVRHSTAKKQDWGLLDMPAALDFLLALTGQKAALLIGHSAGGQLFGLMHNHARLRGVLAVAASSGYVKNIRQDKRTAAKLMLGCVIPLSAMLLGYIPAKKLGWGENLPKAVGLQWAKWCSSPGYVENDFDGEIPHHWYKQFKAPIVFLHAADDEIATKENVLDIMRLFEVAKKKRIFIDPNQIGLDTLGHVDLFRARNQSVWPLLLAQIKEIA